MVSLIFILVLISMVICASIAYKRNLNGPFWVFMGALLGPVAIPLVMAVKQEKGIH